MKSILGKIAEIAAYIIIIPLGILLLIALTPIILAFILIYWVSKASSYLRKDPKHKPPKQYSIYSDGSYPTGINELRNYFNLYIRAIRNSGVTRIEVQPEDLEVGGDGEWDCVTFLAHITTEYGSANLKMIASGDTREANAMFSSMHDGDVPPYCEVEYLQTDGLRTLFNVDGANTVEFFISSLNNGQILSDSGQVWTRVNDNLYIVNYSRKKSDRSDRISSDYGYRRQFSNARVRQYGFDAKPVDS